MGEILGIGTTHHPWLAGTDEAFAGTWQRIINAPRVDEKWRDKELAGGHDRRGRQRHGSFRGETLPRADWANFRKQRKIVDDFKPDFIVIIADDQYENFKETIIPPFCVYGLDDDFEQEVWNHGFMAKQTNYWGEPRDWKMKIHGHREGAKYLTTGLINRGVAMPYAYKLLHSPILAHGFNYTVLYLDCDRNGFTHPVVPFHVNCYGSSVISAEGAFAHLFKEPEQQGLARSARPQSRALLRGRREDGRDPGGKPLSRLHHGVVELVALLPLDQHRLCAARLRMRTGRCSRRSKGRLRDLAAADDRGSRGRRPSRAAELARARRRDGRAEAQAGHSRLLRDLHLPVRQMLRGVPAELATTHGRI